MTFITESKQGFTLIELTVVLFIAGLMFGLGIPSLLSFQEATRFRAAVKELDSAAVGARRAALASKLPVDLLIDTASNGYCLTANAASLSDDQYINLEGDFQLEVTYAAEVSPRPGLAAIRFYPEGGSSGGDITLRRPSGSSVTLSVDWLMGKVTRSTS